MWGGRQGVAREGAQKTCYFFATVRQTRDQPWQHAWIALPCDGWGRPWEVSIRQGGAVGGGRGWGGVGCDVCVVVVLNGPAAARCVRGRVEAACRAHFIGEDDGAACMYCPFPNPP